MDSNQQHRQQRSNKTRRQRGGRTETLGSSYDDTAATHQPEDPQSMSSRETSPGPPRVHSNVAVSTSIPLARAMSTPEVTRIVVPNPHPSQDRHSLQVFRPEDSQTFHPRRSTDADELIILNEGMSPPDASPVSNEKSHSFDFPNRPPAAQTPEKQSLPKTSPLQIPPPALYNPDSYFHRTSSESGRNINVEGNISSVSINPKNEPEERRDWWDKQTPPILIPPDARDRSCRFCNESQSDKYEIITIDGNRKIKKGRLFSPCRCIGNMNYVHVGCLKKWKQASVEEQSSYQCENCQYQYRFYRITLGAFLASRILVHVLTIIFLFGLLYGLGWAAKALDVYALHDSETLPEFLLLDLLHWLIGIIVITLIGLVFLAYQLYNGGTRGLRSLYMWACPCFIGLPGFGPAEKKTNPFNIGFIILVLAFFTPLGMLILISGTYVLFQRSINRVLWRVADNILNVKKKKYE